MIAPILQTAMCEGGKSGADQLTAFEFIKAFTCTYADPAGFLVVGLLVWGGIAAAIYNRQGSVVIPTILLMLTGSAIMSTMAGPAVAIAGLLVLVVGPGVVAYAIYKYSR